MRNILNCLVIAEIFRLFVLLSLTIIRAVCMNLDYSIYTVIIIAQMKTGLGQKLRQNKTKQFCIIYDTNVVQGQGSCCAIKSKIQLLKTKCMVVVILFVLQIMVNRIISNIRYFRNIFSFGVIA